MSKQQLTAPLLSGPSYSSDESSGATSASKLKQKSAGTTTGATNEEAQGNEITVTTSEVVFEVHVPHVRAGGSGSRGTSERVLRLPRDEAELPKVLDSQEPVTAAGTAGSKTENKEKQLDVNMMAKLNIAGQSTKDVANAAHTASFAFHQLVNEFENIGWQSQSKEAAQLALAQQFHDSISKILDRQPMDPLARRQSTTFLENWSSAKGMLERGVDAYIKGIQRVIKTDLDQSVAIAFQGMSYTSRAPILGGEEETSTVSSTLFNMVFGPALFVGRALRNCVRGAAPIEYRETTILRDMSGLIKPGRLTLVLGPPGCGKTSFLKAISGKLYGASNANAILTGDLRYNKFQVKDLRNLAGWVSYVRQSDEHQPLLTTRETLEFAFTCRKLPRYNDPETIERVRRASGEAAASHLLALKDIEVDISLAILGLSGCADTIIGDANRKGVSGGERRRVTLGEMLVTGSQILCCDEISTGLDSAATYDITAFLRSASHTLGTSIVVALLQPPPEVVDLFDDIIVLAEGRIIYHGPREEIQSYFESLGFRCPVGKDLGDFIVELPTRNGLEFQLDRADLQAAGLPAPPSTSAEFALRWKQSEYFRNELHELECERSEPAPPSLFNHDEMPQNTTLQSLWLTMKWSMTLKLRDRVQLVARVMANLVVGFFFGTLFYQLKLDDWWLKAMLFLMVLIFLVSTSFPTVQLMSQQKPVFYKHVEAAFYSAPVFTFAQFIVGIPFVSFDVACFGTVLYWMCGLAPHGDSYLVFLAVSISFGISMNAMMSLFPFITPNEETAVVVAALILILLVVASGALSTESLIPILFRWMIWVNPLAYAYRALAINEYKSGDYELKPCRFEIVGIKLLVPDICSDYFLAVREVRPEEYWIPLSVFVCIGFTIFFLIVMAYAVANIRFDDERTGAVPEASNDVAATSGANGSDKKQKKPTKEELRNHEEDMYLDSVSSRNARSSATAKVTPPNMARHNTILINQKIIAVRELWYTIPINNEPIDFLKGVSFWALPGRMTALMGSSGAGKTTLMDVIAGRKTVGYARGEILVNGVPKVQHEFVKYTGYVEQFGIHANSATVEESLRFSADLRLPSSTSEELRNNFIQDTLELLELGGIRSALAGTLSMEQNKRLTLGVELVANPSIIFCDEPTSGLDARAAAIVMRILLKVARSGRTVVCTIHQPSTAIFNFFDDLLLLKRGGEVVYFGELGEHSKILVDYMEAVPGTKPCPTGYNPATWMLEVIGAGTGAGGDEAKKQVDFAAVYRRSALKSANDTRLNREIAPKRFGNDADVEEQGHRARGITSPMISPYFHENTDPVEDVRLTPAGKKKPETIYVRSQMTQIKYLLIRNFRTYWRSPEFSLNRILVVTLFTTIFACFFYHNELRTVADLEGRIVNIFFFSSLTCMYNLYTLVPFALSRRALYYRERSANMYSVWAFNWAEGLVEVPYIIVQIVITVPLIYFLTNLNNTSYAFFYFALMIFEVLLLMTSMGLFSASLFSDVLAAQLAAVGALITLMVFCGIMVPKDDLPWPYLPFYYISFFKYSSEGLMTTQFTGLNAMVCVPDGKPAATGILHRFPICTKDGSSDFSKITGIQLNAPVFVLEDFAKDYDYDNRYIDLLVVGGWIVGLRAMTFFAMYFINHQKR
jgi:ABC-type multidrug transport system ATPase subunit